MRYVQSLFAQIGEFLAILQSAGAAAAAVRGGRQPAARDLKILGIDPAGFKTIGHA